MCDFKPGDVVVWKSQLDNPHKTPMRYTVVSKPYKHYGVTVVDIIGGDRSSMYSSRQYVEFCGDRLVLCPEYEAKRKSRKVYREETQ